jgi:hypothetical protein
MTSKLPVVLTETDLDVLALMAQVDAQYQIYLETIRAQAILQPRPQPTNKARYTWDHPLHLVIGKEDYALVERTATGDRSPDG